jgi:hypothetical protein
MAGTGRAGAESPGIRIGSGSSDSAGSAGWAIWAGSGVSIVVFLAIGLLDPGFRATTLYLFSE